MVSIPRDTVDVPLPGGSIFRSKLNSLYAYARRNPGAFPGSSGEGTDVLAAAISELLKVKIDYYAVVNLPGFVKLVDSVGGVDVDPDHAFCDNGYHDFGVWGFGIGAGPHHLDGAHALAYARIRKAAGENDFTRARSPAGDPRVAEGCHRARRVPRRSDRLPQGAGRHVETNVPPDILPDLAGLATEIGRDRVYRCGHRLPAGAERGRRRLARIHQVPNVPGIRALSGRLFTRPAFFRPQRQQRPPPHHRGKRGARGQRHPRAATPTPRLRAEPPARTRTAPSGATCRHRRSSRPGPADGEADTRPTAAPSETPSGSVPPAPWETPADAAAATPTVRPRPPPTAPPPTARQPRRRRRRPSRHRPRHRRDAGWRAYARPLR